VPLSLTFTGHALRAMMDEDIDFDEVRGAIEREDVIERYESDRPYPSRLLLGRSGPRPLHVVVATDEAGGHIVITAYVPDPTRWSGDFRRRTT